MRTCRWRLFSVVLFTLSLLFLAPNPASADSSDDPPISPLAGPGVSMYAPDTDLYGGRGVTIYMDFLVTNTGDSPDSFSLYVSDNVWPLILSTTQTPTLIPGQEFYFWGRVKTPNNFDLPSSTALVNALSNADGITRDFVELTIFVVPEPSTWGMLAIGSLAVWAVRRRNR